MLVMKNHDLSFSFKNRSYNIIPHEFPVNQQEITMKSPWNPVESPLHSISSQEITMKS